MIESKANGKAFDGRYLYMESFLNMDPHVAFYLNGIMGVVLMTTSSLAYGLNYTGEFDDFQWIMHMTLWGMNLILWVVTLSIDTVFTRDLYFKSSWATGFIPYIGGPVYIIWMSILHITDRDDKFTASQFWVSFVAWVSYTFLMIAYTKNIVTSIYNYYMIPVVE